MFKKITFWWNCFQDDLYYWCYRKKEQWSNFQGKLYWHIHKVDADGITIRWKWPD